MGDQQGWYAARVALRYALVAVLWIFFSDQAIALIVQGSSDMVVLQSLKGLFFVATTAIVLFIVLHQEFERRARIEAKQHEHDASFRLLFANNPLPMWVYDRENVHFLEVNEAAVAHYGYNRSEFLAMRISDIQSAEELYLQEYLATQTERLRDTSIWKHRLKDGRIIDVVIHSHTLWYNERPAVLVVAEDVSARLQAEAELRDSRTRLAALSQRLLEAQEYERQRIAHELHDEVSQTLTALKINLHIARTPASQTILETLLQESNQILDQVLQQIRTLTLDLQPPLLQELGLVAALEWHTERVMQRSGLTIVVDNQIGTTPIPPELAIICFRVAQEALSNVVRHACATQVQIVIGQETNELTLSIRDNGVGFDPNNIRILDDGLGLVSMREHVDLAGGQFVIESTNGRGTTAYARFPWPTAVVAHTSNSIS